MKTKNVKLIGIVLKILPNAQFLVKCAKVPNDTLCYLSGKMGKSSKPVEGDSVEFEVHPTDTTNGRIISKK